MVVLLVRADEAAVLAAAAAAFLEAAARLLVAADDRAILNHGRTIEEKKKNPSENHIHRSTGGRLKKRKKSLGEPETPQQELSRCLNEMFLALRRLAIAKLRSEEEEEWVGMRMMQGNC
jgi:hypothetical protein